MPESAMPEGDTIFRAARTLHRALAGDTVTGFDSVFPRLTRVHEDTPLTGRIVERVESRGKHLLMHFSGGLILRTHMLMSGSWHIYRHDERWQRPPRDMRVIVETAAFVAVAFNIQVAEFETPRTIERHESLGSLGPDLLNDRFDVNDALARLRTQGDQHIGEVLLNQRVMAGIGNIFKSETLYVSRVNPFTPVSAIPDDRLRAIVDTARTLLQANVTASSGDGIVTYTALHRPTTRRGHPADRLWVYGRQHEPCRTCGTKIAMRKVGLDARSTYWCPQCQPEAEMRPGQSS
jgi:endonuclease VIII